MSEVTGVIQKIETNQRGKYLMADVFVAGEKYGFGLAKTLEAKEGDYVKFQVEENRGFLNIVRDSMKVSEHKPPAEALAEAKVSVTKPSYSSFDSRQDAISRQAASNTAIAWMNFLGSQGVVELPASKTKTKGAHMAALDELRRGYERDFYEHNTGQAYKDISPEAAESKETDDATPSDEAWE